MVRENPLLPDKELQATSAGWVNSNIQRIIKTTITILQYSTCCMENTQQVTVALSTQGPVNPNIWKSDINLATDNTNYQGGTKHAVMHKILLF